MKNLLDKLKNSSTLWVSILLPTLNVLTQHLLGVTIPWDVILTGIGAYGVKEAAGKLASSKVAQS
jgi:hypothetical protein|tara:strand:- start:175 stop:369 length:195 start_codon:yes stop_codon:yes gene_type:complete